MDGITEVVKCALKVALKNKKLTLLGNDNLLFDVGHVILNGKLFLYIQGSSYRVLYQISRYLNQT